MRHILTALCLAVACSPTLAADTPKKEPTEKQKAQQQRMTDCNKKAEGKKGDERKAFMSGCLSGKDTPAAKADEKKQTAQTGKKAPTQQEKMTACNKEASAKALKGKERDTFMSSCLKG